MNQVSILEFPFNLGLKAQSPGHEPGVKKLPEALRAHGFHRLIGAGVVQTLAAPAYKLELNAEHSLLNADSVIEYAHKQAALLSEVLPKAQFPIALGGDCSIVVGIALALKQRGNYALFYLDGHTDFIGPELSETKAVGGMAAAIAAGRGPTELTNIDNQQPYIPEKHVWCVGNREYDDAYEDAIRFSDATYVSLNKLRAEGIPNCIDSFLRQVHEQQLDGFWLHIDVDVLHDELMPAVDSRTPDGLTYEEFNSILALLLNSPQMAGLDITILDPERDPQGKYTAAFVSNFTQTFNSNSRPRSTQA